VTIKGLRVNQPLCQTPFYGDRMITFEAIKQDNHRKVPYPRTQQRVRRRWELNLSHAIVIVRSTKKRQFQAFGNYSILIILRKP